MRFDRRLLLLLAGALAIRLLLMPLPEPYPADLSTFWVPWMNTAAGEGLAELYRHGQPPVNYPPLYLAVLAALGRIHGLLVPDMAFGPWQRVLIKLPAVLADLAIAALLYWAVRRGLPSPDRSVPLQSRLPLAAAALWALNPAAIYDSAYWGQVDSIHTLWMLAALLAALRGRWGRAGALMALALLTKLQAIVLLPLLAYLAWRAGLRGLVRSGAGLAAALAVGLAPFALSGTLGRVVGVYTGSVGFYKWVTMNAHNIWFPVQILVAKLHDVRLTDDIVLWGPVTLRWVGLGLMAGYALVLLWALHRWYGGQGAGEARSGGYKEEGKRYIGEGAEHGGRGFPSPLYPIPFSVHLPFFAAGLLVFGFFMLPTEIHERYSLPALAFLAVAAWRDRWTLLAYGLLTVTIFLNLVEVLPFARWVWDLLRTIPNERVLFSLVNVALLAWLTWRYLMDTTPRKGIVPHGLETLS